MEITGRITKDAILAKIGKDKQVINFSIAINDAYKPKGASEIKHVVTYINCDYWLSPALLPYLKKGCLVSLFGRIGLSVYLSHEGNPLGSLTFHVNHLKILAFAKKESENIPSAVPSQNSSDEDPDDLPF
ncbi:single-stranded DNA-binding protein [Flavobacterium sp. Root420]|uniref:single-stranded DNA-binding protein n=1 Tax=Flavobacterium sp. Root420 TaxID=1736533 RepID=UPI0006FB265A|nr:single-stranded DNA-binding protein [Flavobacterium sp. Root420]KQX00958.1 single-stranded DNA-binding protein [Flavobacterium sp. Root420]